jgi:stage V sporulation protein D (sporulation-specific penicillin-binding protein)
MSARSKEFKRLVKLKVKLAYLVVVLALIGLAVRVIYINVTKGEEYSEAAVSQLGSSSTTIPYERGEILDRNGNVLATNEKTYKLIIEPANIILSDDYITDTRAALLKYYDINAADFDKYINAEKEKADGESGDYYEVLAKGLTYDEVKAFQDYCKTDESGSVMGVQFETVYKRIYPNDSLACNLLGYTTDSASGSGGIEGYYNDYLNGVDGKTYSYVSGSSSVDTETVAAQDGDTIVSTIDMNIQKIVEENIADYMEEVGAKQIGVIAMNPNNGEVLAMASSRTYNPNDYEDPQALRNMTVTVTETVELDGPDEDADSLISVESAETNDTQDEDSEALEDKTPSDVEDLTGEDQDSDEDSQEDTDSEEDTDDTDSEEDTEDTKKKNTKTQKVEYDFSQMTDEEFDSVTSKFTDVQLNEALNYVWQNFCISDVYEPGSTYKTFTVAGALEDNVISDGDEYYCDGYEIPVEGESPIYCHNSGGHGTVTIKQAMAYSCNDALMQIAADEGATIFDKYQVVFNFGSKTGIDLEGETSGIKYDVDSLKAAELATSSFGQGVTVSMIQIASAFCSVINGGNYYVPHVVKRIVDSDGNVVQNVEPILVRKTISQEVSDYMREYLQAVVESGTGTSAAFEGYTIGGKTGTAEKLPRGNGNYVLSFTGFVPVENPQFMLYVVVDEPHVADQDGSAAGPKFFHQVMEDLLPYLNIYETNDEDVEYDGVTENLTSSFVGDDSTTTEGDATADETTDTTVAADTTAADTTEVTDTTAADTTE